MLVCASRMSLCSSNPKIQPPLSKKNCVYTLVDVDKTRVCTIHRQLHGFGTAMNLSRQICGGKFLPDMANGSLCTTCEAQVS